MLVEAKHRVRETSHAEHNTNVALQLEVLGDCATSVTCLEQGGRDEPTGTSMRSSADVTGISAA